jgi:hypothetical protein
MKYVYKAGLFSLLFVSALACGQEPAKPAGRSSLAPLELKLIKGPQWKGGCLELTIQRTNLSQSSIFLDATYEDIEVYSSVSIASKTIGRGPGEKWLLVYGWTDVVVSEPLKLAPGARRQNTLCIAETFPVKETGNEILRQVRVQGKLRIVASYGFPTLRIVDQPQRQGRRSYVRTADSSSRWTFRETALEIPVPCPSGLGTSDCLSPAQIFPGEHDVHMVEVGPSPVIEVQLPSPPMLPIDSPAPPKPPKSQPTNAPIGTDPPPKTASHPTKSPAMLIFFPGQIHDPLHSLS